MSFLSRVFNLGRGAGQLAAGNSTTIFTDGLGDAADPINHYSNVLDDVSVAANAVDKICKAAMTTNPLCTLDKKYVDTTATKLLEQASKTITGDELLYKVVEDLHKGFLSRLCGGEASQLPAYQHHTFLSRLCGGEARCAVA